MRLLNRKQQIDILDNLLLINKGLEHEALFGKDDENRKRYIEAFNAIAEIADVVTGIDGGMFMGFARRVSKTMRQNGEVNENAD